MNATQTKTEASIAVATRSASRELRLGAITAERRKARANKGAIRILSEARADQAFAAERVGPSPCEVVEERRDGRRCDDKGGDGEHAPEGAIGPEEEERSPGWNDGGYSEHAEKQEVVTEGEHGAIILSIRAARGGDVGSHDRGSERECADVAGANEPDLNEWSHQRAMPTSRRSSILDSLSS